MIILEKHSMFFLEKGKIFGVRQAVLKFEHTICPVRNKPGFAGFISFNNSKKAHSRLSGNGLFHSLIWFLHIAFLA